MFKLPPIATYLEPSPGSKAIDLVNLCRRIIAEMQYADDWKSFGNFVEVHHDPAGHASARARELIQQSFECLTKDECRMMKNNFGDLEQLPVTKYLMNIQHPFLGNRVTAKNFRAHQHEAKPGLKREEIIEIYWRFKTRFCCDLFTQIVGQLVEDFKKLKYDGFLLPNGKVVSFESMHQLHFFIEPKEMHLIDYRTPDQYLYNESAFTKLPDVLKMLARLHNLKASFHHTALMFNIAEKEGVFGKEMIIDPTCAQFGMKGMNGELLYWGSFNDYYKALQLQVNMTVFQDFKIYNYFTEKIKNDASTQRLMKGVLTNLNSDSCGYCGEVERKENPEVKLKKCSKCRKVFYCDALCQKLAWKGHKMECKCD